MGDREYDVMERIEELVEKVDRITICLLGENYSGGLLEDHNILKQRVRALENANDIIIKVVVGLVIGIGVGTAITLIDKVILCP